MAALPGKSGVAYMPQLDGIRAFAVGAVIMEHWASGLPRPLRGMVERLDLGGLGVECFFVLSGFLITLILLELKEEHRSFRTALGHFYVRRVLRIFPAYYFALLFTSLLFPEMRSVLGWHALYLSNVYPAWHGAWPPIGGHFWTLSVEEQFYLLWPLVVLVLPLASVKRLAIALILLAPVWRFAVWQVADGSHVALWTLTPGAVDLLCFGALLACMRAAGSLTAAALRVLTVSGAVALVLYALLYVFLRDTLAYAVLSRSFTALFFGALVATASRGLRGPAGSVLGSAPVVWLGLISYGLYIWHPFIPKAYVLLVDIVGLDGRHFAAYYVRYPLMAALLLLVTSSSYYLLERPVRSLKKHFAAASARRGYRTNPASADAGSGARAADAAESAR